MLKHEAQIITIEVLKQDLKYLRKILTIGNLLEVLNY